MALEVAFHEGFELGLTGSEGVHVGDVDDEPDDVGHLCALGVDDGLDAVEGGVRLGDDVVVLGGGADGGAAGDVDDVEPARMERT